MVLIKKRRRFMPRRQPLPPNPYFNPQRKPQRTERRRGLFIAIGILVVIFFGGAYWFLTSSHYAITHPIVETNSAGIEKELTDAVDRYLQQKTFGFFSTRNYWALNERALRSSITNALADTVKLENLTVEKRYPAGLHITASVYQPSVRFVSAPSSTVYVLDPEGTVTGTYEQPPVGEGETPPAPTLPLLRDNNNRIVQIGKQMASKELVEAVDMLFKQQGQYKVAFDSFAIPEIHCPVLPAVLEEAGNTNTATNANNNTNSAPSTNGNTNSSTANSNRAHNTNTAPECQRNTLIIDTVQVNAQLVDGPIVYFSLTHDLTEAMDRLRLFIDSKKAEVPGFSYIDVRFPERVYYQ